MRAPDKCLMSIKHPRVQIPPPRLLVSVALYIRSGEAVPQKEGNFVAVSRRLGVTPPTLARRYDRYSALVNKVAAMKAAEHRQRLSNWNQETATETETTNCIPQLRNS